MIGTRVGRLGGALLIVVVALAGVVLAGGLVGHGSALGSPSAVAPTAGDSFEPVLGAPATNVVMIGASSAAGEVWALGELGSIPVMVNGRAYSDQVALLGHAADTTASGWQIMPLPTGPGGQPISASTGTSTSDGGIALISSGGIVTRDPGGQPQLAREPESEPKLEPEHSLLGEGETLPAGGSMPYAAVEDGAHTGVLITPLGDGKDIAAGVLHYDGEKWMREPIEGVSTKRQGFTPKALACPAETSAGSSSASSCWLLAEYKTEGSTGSFGRLVLFQREAVGATERRWQEQPIEDEQPLLGELKPPTGESTSVTALGEGAQTLTATTQGVWVDFEAKSGSGEAVDITKLIIPSSGSGAKSRGTWCFTGATSYPGGGTFCTEAHWLGGLLPGRYRSFAWPGSGGSPGTRIITGLSNREMLELAGESFSVVAGAGGNNGSSPGGAAFVEPDQGWIADGVEEPTESLDGQGQSQVIEVSAHPAGDELAEESVPFRRPLYAVAQAPGTTPGDPNAQAIAVGAEGEIAHYIPGQGWRSESLYNAKDEAEKQTLRGVAWPEPGRAYAVGDNGTMWLWRAETGLWVQDPAKPLNFVGNLAAIAFSQVNPYLGYAVGRQGVLLRFGKSWEQEALPAELQEVNFTSVTFAGTEALATYRTLSGQNEVGGIAVREGSGPWHVDAGAKALLEQLPQTKTVLSRVAGLPDGGVVAAGPGLVIECDSECGSANPWRFSSQPLPEAQNVSALAAYREPSGPVRAVVSIDLDQYLNPQRWDGEYLESQGSPYKIDAPPVTVAGEPHPFLPPDFLPNSGYVLKETSSGWADMEHDALPATAMSGTGDDPSRPDPVLALIVGSSGTSGLAVGGQTGDIEGLGPRAGIEIGDLHHQTAAAMRFPSADASSNGIASAPVQTKPGESGFVVGGEASCSAECAPWVNEGIGPEVWLEHALASANQIAGLRGFLYTGAGGNDVFSRVLSSYAGSLPVFGPESGNIAPGVRHGPGDSYAFTSEGAGGPIAGIVLTFAEGKSAEESEQEWLAHELAEAHGQGIPAIVMGRDSIGFGMPQGPRPPSVNPTAIVTISSILVRGGASAYFFDAPERNVAGVISSGGKNIPTYGTGTLGYVEPPEEEREADSLGSSGFLLAEVAAPNTEYCAAHGFTAGECAIVPVTARVVPNISQLALDATDGVLLHRSKVALFEALARRPNAGAEVGNTAFGTEWRGPDPYDPIPFDCLGDNCVDAVPGDYTFTSSNPEVGGFVVHEPTSANSHQVLVGSNQLPVIDEPRNAKGELNPGDSFDENEKGEPINEKGQVVPRDQSGLFCAFNAGTTIVSITTGGLTYSEPVTVQAGSVEYPCGTVPLKNPPVLRAPARASFEVPPLSPNSPKSVPSVPAVHIPVPQAPSLPVTHQVVKKPKAKPSYPFVYLPVVLYPILAVVPPPIPTAIRPTPPSGTAQVPAQSPITQAVPQEQEEEQQAVEHVHHYAGYRPASEFAPNSRQHSTLTAYSHPEQGPMPAWPLGLVLILVAAGVAFRPNRGEDKQIYAREHSG
jgi:hypothetical protein